VLHLNIPDARQDLRQNLFHLAAGRVAARHELEDEKTGGGDRSAAGIHATAPPDTLS
jgi:hypothetical protein